jgi:hypothetical protein
MCIITMMSNSAYALIAPFLPIELHEKGIATNIFGYIFRYVIIFYILSLISDKL